MALSDFFARLSPSKRRAEKASKARDELKANAEKALRMKQENDTGSRTPQHQTANDGMQPHDSSNLDHMPAKEGFGTPQLKRSRVARSGDAS
jgi:hypothetical protein